MVHGLTLLSQRHLQLQHLELIARVGVHLSAHPLSAPLLEAVELLVDVHFGSSLSLAGKDKVCRVRL